MKYGEKNIPISVIILFELGKSLKYSQYDKIQYR